MTEFHTVQHIHELFSLQGEDFVRAAYETLLGRLADEHGLALYVGRLAAGYDKAEILTSLADSAEARERDVRNIPGVKQMMKEHRQRHHWFWGWFSRRKHYERTIRQLAFAVESIQRTMHNMPESVAAMQKSAELESVGQDLTSTVKEIQAILSKSLVNDRSTTGIGAILSPEDVRNAFLDVLGREPENDDVIAHHQNVETVETLRTALMESEEFQSNFSTEHAKFIFSRMKQITGVTGN